MMTFQQQQTDKYQLAVPRPALLQLKTNKSQLNEMRTESITISSY